MSLHNINLLVQCCELSKDTVLVLNIKQFYSYVETVNLFAGITQFLYRIACFNVFWYSPV